MRNIRLGSTIDGLVRKEKYELPPEAIREMIINTHCHRNLLDESCIQVAIYDDRLEVTSPGGLYNRLTYEEVMNGHSKIRNKAIANIFSQMGLVEAWGSGIKRIFNIGGGRPKTGHLALNRKLLGAFFYEGESYEFNFSKFWTLTRTEFSCEETETQVIWHVEQETPLHRMVTDITCEKKEMLLINYEAPDGTKRHNRLWNGGNGKGTVKLYERRFGKERLIDIVRAENVGCEYGEYSTGRR